MLGVDPLGYEQLAGAVAEHVHVLTASNAQVASLRHEALTRKLAASQAPVVSVKRAPSRALAATQGAVATMLYNRPHSQATTQTQAAQLGKLVGRRLILAQPQAAVRAAGPSRALAATQASSYGPQLPPTPLTVRLEEEEILSFPTAAWTVLAWAESIGVVYQKNKGLVGKQKPVGWGTTELKKLGARYNVAPFADPINSTIIRDADTATSAHFVAIGICVPSNGERSGYIARIETVAGANLKVTLERWINGAKAVLAETTLELAYFGAISTEKEAPFALTLVGGVLRLWLAKPSATPTVLLSAADTTFTSGYNTMESLGGWQIAQFHAATMDARVLLEAHPSRGQVLSATQGSSATRATQVARTLAPGQAQTSAVGRVVARALATIQAQAASPTRTVARGLSAGQAQGARLGRSRASSLSITQGQSATRGSASTRTLVAIQPQGVVRTTAISRLLAASQDQSATRGAEPTRRLFSAATQVASRLPAGHARAQTLSTAQPQAATRSASVSRTLVTTQAQAATRRTAISRAFSAAVASIAAHAAVLVRTLSASQGQVAAQRRESAAADLGASQPQSVVLGRAVARSLAGTQTSLATISYDVIEVPLPPPVKMSASSSTKEPASSVEAPQGDSSASSPDPTSTTTTNALDGSVSDARLTSSVETRR